MNLRLALIVAVASSMAWPAIAGAGTVVSQPNEGAPAVEPMLDRPSWFTEGFNSPASGRGESVAAADVNGDGYDDAVVGASLYPSGNADWGVVLVYHGSSSGLTREFPDWYLVGPNFWSSYGQHVANAGDVNGDGYDDILFTEFVDAESIARVHAVHGSPTGLEPAPAWSFDHPTPGGALPLALSTAGDVNGDGFDDVIIGDPRVPSDSGRAWVFHGSANGLKSTPDWQVTGPTESRLGWSVSGGGDVNGDGYDDVILGLLTYTNGEESEGGAYLFHGSLSGLSAEPDWTAESNQAGSAFGIAVSLSSPTLTARPGVRVPRFARRGFDDARPDSIRQPRGSQFGRSLSWSDVNGDGFDDLVVGSPNYTNPQLAGGGGIDLLRFDRRAIACTIVAGRE